MARHNHFVVFFFVLVAHAVQPLAADDVAKNQKASKQQESEQPAFELKPEVREVLQSLFATINKADVSRVTVELSADSVLNGKIVESQKSTYQIASRHPDKLTVYLKESEQRTRIYCNGETMVVALAPDAYYVAAEPIDVYDAVTDLTIPMGPYPEPVMALSLAGVDASLTFLGGMKSVEIIDRGKFRGRHPAIHLRGVQNDAVTWDFWVSQDKPYRPLRLLVDLTAMLKATNKVQVPRGYSYQLQFDFLSWRMSGDIDDSLFVFKAAKDAIEYDSLNHYFESIAGAVAEHPLLGQPAPEFDGEMLDGEEVSLDSLKGKVVVLDFWATWCEPCVMAMPVLAKVTKAYEEKDVVFLAVNVSEDPARVKGFVEEQEWDVSFVLDPNGKIADAFRADAIPQTVLIGKTGAIESVHLGLPGLKELEDRLTDELEVLSIGGHIEGEAKESRAPTKKPSKKK